MFSDPREHGQLVVSFFLRRVRRIRWSCTRHAPPWVSRPNTRATFPFRRWTNPSLRKHCHAGRACVAPKPRQFLVSSSMSSRFARRSIVSRVSEAWAWNSDQPVVPTSRPNVGVWCESFMRRCLVLRPFDHDFSTWLRFALVLRSFFLLFPCFFFPLLVVFRDGGFPALLFDVDGFGCHGSCHGLAFLPFGSTVSSSHAHARACARRRSSHRVCRHLHVQPTSAPYLHSLSLSVSHSLSQSPIHSLGQSLSLDLTH